jgi:hypothetical protein
MQTSLGGTSRPALGPPEGAEGKLFPSWYKLHILRIATSRENRYIGYVGPIGSFPKMVVLMSAREA